MSILVSKISLISSNFRTTNEVRFFKSVIPYKCVHIEVYELNTWYLFKKYFSKNISLAIFGKDEVICKDDNLMLPSDTGDPSHTIFNRKKLGKLWKQLMAMSWMLWNI